MTLRVVFRRAAKSEFEEAAVWYEERRPGLGEEFIREIGQAIESAVAAPRATQLRSATSGVRSRGAFRFVFTSGCVQIRWLSSRYSTAAGILQSGSAGYD